MQVQFNSKTFDVTIESYGTNGRTAIILTDEDDDYFAGSVNLVGVPMEADEVAIKDYSECEGMLTALVTAGIVQPPHRHVGQGFVEFPICRLVR